MPPDLPEGTCIARIFHSMLLSQTNYYQMLWGWEGEEWLSWTRLRGDIASRWVSLTSSPFFTFRGSTTTFAEIPAQIC
jgi:hypothetical protein